MNKKLFKKLLNEIELSKIRENLTITESDEINLIFNETSYMDFADKDKYYGYGSRLAYRIGKDRLNRQDDETLRSRYKEDREFQHKIDKFEFDKYKNDRDHYYKKYKEERAYSDKQEKREQENLEKQYNREYDRYLRGIEIYIRRFINQYKTLMNNNSMLSNNDMNTLRKYILDMHEYIVEKLEKLNDKYVMCLERRDIEEVYDDLARKGLNFRELLYL